MMKTSSMRKMRKWRPTTAKPASAFPASAMTRMKPPWIPMNKSFLSFLMSSTPYSSPSRTPRRLTPKRLTFGTPRVMSPRTGFKSAPARASAAIARSPRLRGYARTGGYYGRYPAELKFLNLDTTINTAAGAAAFGYGTLCPLPLGDGPSARIGRQVTLTSVQLNYSLDIHHTETNVIYLRVLLVIDKQCNGVGANWLDIMSETSVHAYRNLDNVDRFVIIYDKIHRFSPSALSSAGSLRYSGPSMQMVYKKLNLPIVYDNTAATGVLATIRSNNISMLALMGGAQTNLNDFKSRCRVRYRDD